MAKIVDADTHIIEHPGVWERFSKELYHRRPMLSITDVDAVPGRRSAVWLIDGAAVPKRTGKGSVALAVGGSDAEEARTDIERGVRYITDPMARVRDMDARGVDVEVVYPTLLLAYVTSDPELEVAICEAYNSYMADAWRTAGDRLRWVVVPPLRDIDASVRQIEHGREHGAVGIFFRGVEGDRSLADRYFDPVYAIADRLGMAVCVHTGAGSPQITAVFDRTVSHNLPHVRSLPLYAFRDLVAHRVPERFPNLRFGFIEASASWVPYVLHHLSRSTRSETIGGSPDARMEWGPTLFQEYRLYVAAETDEDLPYLLAYTGTENMVMGSDYGHQDQSKDSNMVSIMRKREDLAPAVIEQILSDNPRRLYGIDG